MSVVKWKFYDPHTTNQFVFFINPKEGGSPGVKKRISSEHTATTDGGRTIFFEGRREPTVLEFGGSILTADQYNAMVLWFFYGNQIRLTDDLDRQFWIVLTEFAPRRVRSQGYPNKHSYTAKAQILDIPTPTP